MEYFTATRKLKFFFLPLEMFDACTTGDKTSPKRLVIFSGRPLSFCLHRHPVSVNCLNYARMVLSVSGSFAYFARNARCTLTTDLHVCTNHIYIQIRNSLIQVGQPKLYCHLFLPTSIKPTLSRQTYVLAPVTKVAVDRSVVHQTTNYTYVIRSTNVYVIKYASSRY